MIPIFRPNIPEEGITELKKVIDSHWLGMGPKTSEFEKAFAKYTETKYCVALNSCTSALDLALRLLDLKRTDEVIVPVITFVSTGHAVIYNRAKLVFVDVDPVTLNINFDDLARKITDHTKAIIVVHYSGRPVDFDRLREVIGNRKIMIIEDAAHASGSIYKGKKCGSLGDLACFSFHAVKPLAIGDGGAITLNDEALAKRAKRLSWMGINKGTWDRVVEGQKYGWEYNVDEIGFKYHMNDLQASLALVQLKNLDAGIGVRKERVEYYYHLLEWMKEIELPLLDDENFKSSWHIFHIKCQNRNELGAYLISQGISVGVHYRPIHLFKCYKSRAKLPIAESVFERILTLPLFETLTFNEIDFIIEQIRNFYVSSKSK